MSRVDARYICQNAANAIISEIGPYRVSTDALQSINQFLDEFLVFLLSSSLSLDLSRIKAVVFTLLPSTLGKNAIVEAELEVKTFTETEAIDFETYEQMRTLGSDGPFPLDDALPLLREKCLEFCTLADKDEHSILQLEPKNQVYISPIVAIYVTTVLEHIAEYVLTAIAMTAEHEDTEYIRVKEVFLALIDDVQVGSVFYRMELREKLEKRAFAYGYRPRAPPAPSYIAPQRQIPTSTSGSTNGDGSFLDINFDDLDIGYDDDDDRNHAGRSSTHDHLSLSTYSLKSSASGPDRPNSMMTSSTSNGTISTAASLTTGKKPPHKVFKKETVSVYDPDTQTMDFEELIRSGNTMKVSLTPNRLRSIEIKDQLADEPATPTISWERRSTASMPRGKGSAPSSRAASPAPAVPSTFPGQNTPKKDSILDDALKGYQSKQHTMLDIQRSSPAPTSTVNDGTIPTQSSNTQAQHKPQVQPVTGKKIPSTSVCREEPAVRNENLRDAPKSPVAETSMPSPASAPVTPSPSKAKTSNGQKNSSEQPVAKKEVKVLRRSSMSSRKSRENLRRQREKEEAAAAAAAAASSTPDMPASTTQVSAVLTQKTDGPSTAVTTKRSIESVDNMPRHPLPSPPASEASSSVELKQEERLSSKSESSSVDSVSDTEERRVHFKNKDQEPMQVESPVDMTNSKEEPEPERPSSIVAKRASLVGSSRRRSLHENYAVDANRSDKPRQRIPTAGSVESSIKAWDEIMKQGEDTITPAAARRRSMLQQNKSEEEQSDKEVEAVTRPRTPSQRQQQRPNSVLDKVMQFERASSLNDFAQQHHRQHRASAYIPRRERFLYLQREPGLLERRSNAATSFTRSKPVTKDAETQTDPLPELKPVSVSQQTASDGPPALVIITEDDDGVTARKEIDMDSFSEKSSEHGMVEGDEEWFLQDDEWEDVQDQEVAVVEWLLGEA